MRICARDHERNSVSHANMPPAALEPQSPARPRLVDGQVAKIDVCTKCLKAGKVTKAVRGRRRLTTV